MTNNTRTALYSGLLLLAIIIGACTKDSIPPESNYKQPHNFRLSAAREFYEENFGNLSFPELYLKPIVQTKGSNYFHNLTQTPLWDNFHFVENDWSYIYEIPILYNTNLNAYFGHITEDGKMIKKDKDIKLQSNLIIQKYKKSGNIHVFLSTIIGHITTPDKPTEGLSPWLWTGDRRNFTGYQFFTNTDGSFRSAFQYKNGTRKNIRLDIYDHTEEYNHPQEVFSIKLGSLDTKGEGMYEPSKWCSVCQKLVDPNELYCPKCGQGVIDEVIVLPKPDPEPDPPGAERCNKCNFLIENCICGREPGDDDDVCPYCGFADCSGECRETGGGSNGGDGVGGPSPDSPQPDDNLSNVLLTVNITDGGMVSGQGYHAAGERITLSAIANEGYIFTGWSGDLSGRSLSETVTVSSDLVINAHFDPLNSTCGKLAKALSNYSDLLRYRSMVRENSSREYGYVRTISELREVTGSQNSVNLPLLSNVIETVHTHDSAIHPSIADLKKLYWRFRQDDIYDYNNFRNTIITQDYIMVMEVDDISRIRHLVIEENIVMESDDDYSLTFNEWYENQYNNIVTPSTSASSYEEIFVRFLSFMDQINSGFKISLHKIDESTKVVTSQNVDDITNYHDLFNNPISTCIK